jgi:hypothetical protein
MKDYYAVLEIAANSTESDIRKAYRRLAKQYHPDVNKAKNAHEKFIEISEAYDFLINHSQQHKEAFTTAPAEGKNNNDDRASEEFERFRQEAREKAEQQAKMRYETFKKQHEAFQKSGINDLALLFTVIVRIAIIPLFFFLLLLPVQIALHNEWTMIFLFLITWPFAGIIAWYVYGIRKQYFMPGKLYYTPERIKQIYSGINPTEQKCYYCPSKPADSKSYKLDLLKLKDLRVKSGGFRQHNVNYMNEKATILVPRSRKAFFIHSVNTGIRIASILSCLVFLDISSLVWRIIIGVAIGGLISSLISLITRTKSNVSYLFSYGTLFRVAVWIFILAQISHFSIEPFNITTSDYIYFVITAIVLFDCFLMQLVNFAFGKYSSKPITNQYADTTQKFNDGYRVYNDITVISVVYPLFKWIFG